MYAAGCRQARRGGRCCAHHRCDAHRLAPEGSTPLHPTRHLGEVLDEPLEHIGIVGRPPQVVGLLLRIVATALGQEHVQVLREAGQGRLDARGHLGEDAGPQRSELAPPLLAGALHALQERGDPRLELLRLEGLDDIVIRSAAQALEPIPQVALGGEKDKGDAGPREGLDAPLEREPIHALHHDIGDDEIGR